MRNGPSPPIQDHFRAEDFEGNHEGHKVNVSLAGWFVFGYGVGLQHGVIGFE